MLLVAVALALRIIDLGARPFHHDESQDAYSRGSSMTGRLRVPPILHGPLRFYLTASMYVLFGDSDFTARLAPALMGTVLVGLPYSCRPVGRRRPSSPARCSPSAPAYLYFSRFAREDIYIACITMGLSWRCSASWTARAPAAGRSSPR